jgi:hypothetical protein
MVSGCFIFDLHAVVVGKIKTNLPCWMHSRLLTFGERIIQFSVSSTSKRVSQLDHRAGPRFGEILLICCRCLSGIDDSKTKHFRVSRCFVFYWATPSLLRRLCLFWVGLCVPAY